MITADRASSYTAGAAIFPIHPSNPWPRMEERVGKNGGRGLRAKAIDTTAWLVVGF
jgi:hypothetical protein